MAFAGIMQLPSVSNMDGWGRSTRRRPIRMLVDASGPFDTPGSTPIPPQPNASQYINVSTPGSIVAPVWPTTNPSVLPLPGTTGGLPAVTNGVFVPDANQNR